MNRTTLLSIITSLAPAVSRITNGHILFASGHASAVSEQFAISVPCDTGISCCPDYSTLKAALSGLTGETVTLTQAAESLVLNSKGRRTVRCLPVETFPELPDDSGADSITVSGDSFAEAIAFVVRAAHDDVSRPHLNGVHLNGNDVVATDGTRLRVQRIAESLPTCTIPTAAAHALCRLMTGPVNVTLGRRFTVYNDTFHFSTSLIAGEFPPHYAKVIPDGTGRKLVIDIEETVRAVNAVAAFADSKTKRIFLTLDDENVMLSCDAAEEPLNVVSWEGGGHKVLVNGALLADMLTAFGKGQVMMTLQNDPAAPLLFRDSDGRTGVLMPVRQ